MPGAGVRRPGQGRRQEKKVPPGWGLSPLWPADVPPILPPLSMTFPPYFSSAPAVFEEAGKAFPFASFSDIHRLFQNN